MTEYESKWAKKWILYLKNKFNEIDSNDPESFFPNNGVKNYLSLINDYIENRDQIYYYEKLNLKLPPDYGSKDYRTLKKGKPESETVRKELKDIYSNIEHKIIRSLKNSNITIESIIEYIISTEYVSKLLPNVLFYFTVVKREELPPTKEFTPLLMNKIEPHLEISETQNFWFLRLIYPQINDEYINQESKTFLTQGFIKKTKFKYEELIKFLSKSSMLQNYYNSINLYYSQILDDEIKPVFYHIEPMVELISAGSSVPLPNLRLVTQENKFQLFEISYTISDLESLCYWILFTDHTFNMPSNDFPFNFAIKINDLKYSRTDSHATGIKYPSFYLKGKFGSQVIRFNLLNTICRDVKDNKSYTSVFEAVKNTIPNNKLRSDELELSIVEFAIADWRGSILGIKWIKDTEYALNIDYHDKLDIMNYYIITRSEDYHYSIPLSDLISNNNKIHIPKIDQISIILEYNYQIIDHKDVNLVNLTSEESIFGNISEEQIDDLIDQVAKRQNIRKPRIRNYIWQFENNIEKYIALLIIKRLMIVTLEDFKEDRQRIVNIIEGFKIGLDYKDKPYIGVIEDQNVDKSGDLLRYTIKSSISYRKFPQVEDQILDDNEFIIFIEDFVGTGAQALDYLEQFLDEYKSLNKTINILLIVLYGYNEGIQTILNSIGSQINIRVLNKITDRDRVHNPNFIFNPEQIGLVSTFLEKYGIPDYERGFKECGSIVISELRCSNDVPSFLWRLDKDWSPLFSR